MKDKREVYKTVIINVCILWNNGESTIDTYHHYGSFLSDLLHTFWAEETSNVPKIEIENVDEMIMDAESTTDEQIRKSIYKDIIGIFDSWKSDGLRPHDEHSDYVATETEVHIAVVKGEPRIIKTKILDS